MLVVAQDARIEGLEQSRDMYKNLHVLNSENPFIINLSAF